MRRAQQRMAEDIKDALAEAQDQPVDGERRVHDEQYPVTQSGIVPRAAESGIVLRVMDAESDVVLRVMDDAESDVVLRVMDAAESGMIPRAEPAAPGAPLSTGARVLRSLRLHKELADLAAQPVALGAEEGALHAIVNACAALEEIQDRRPYTRVLLGVGECLVDLGFPQYAEPRLRETVEFADALPDARLGAAARRALGRARLMLGDPSCQASFEDARAMFEQLGDHEATLAADRLLRAAQTAILEVPRLRRASGQR